MAKPTRGRLSPPSGSGLGSSSHLLPILARVHPLGLIHNLALDHSLLHLLLEDLALATVRLRISIVVAVVVK